MAVISTTQRADAQGADVLAHRRAAGGKHDIAARNPTGRAELGLPLRVGARFDVRAVGLYTLGLEREADDFFSFIAEVSCANNEERRPLQVMYGVGGERELVEEEWPSDGI